MPLIRLQMMPFVLHDTLLAFRLHFVFPSDKDDVNTFFFNAFFHKVALFINVLSFKPSILLFNFCSNCTFKSLFSSSFSFRNFHTFPSYYTSSYFQHSTSIHNRVFFRLKLYETFVFPVTFHFQTYFSF